jgi:CBS domain containing-hemolysin-like protein
MFGQHADPRVTTVAGLVQAALGRIPRVGDAVTLGNLRIQVEFVSGNIVHRLVVSLLDRHAVSGAITA